MQVRSKSEPVRYVCTCLTCGGQFGKARMRGRIDLCRQCQVKAKLKAWKAENPGRKRELNSRWSAANREKDRELKAAWQKRNLGAGAAKTMRYHADKLERTPPWSDIGAIKAFYVMAQRARECTGIRFEVDHLLPLRGKRVSGLHVPHNLRVVTRQENMEKGNRYGA